MPSVESLTTHIAITDEPTKMQIRIAPSASVYAADMVNSFDYYHGAVVPFVAAGGYRVADYSSPRWHEIAGFNHHPILCPSLAEPYAGVKQYLDFAQLQPGQTVLDLGGYSGLTAIAFSYVAGPWGRVIVAEPDPVNFSACEKNLALHRRMSGLDNVTTLPVAVSDSTGTIQFSAESSMGSAPVEFVGCCRGNVVSVPSVTLADMARDLDRVDFVKIDIEGAELGVLVSSRSFFLDHRPKVIVEAHFVSGAICTDGIIAALKEYNYDCEVMAQPGVAFPLVAATPLSI